MKTDFATLLPPLLERVREGDSRAEDEAVTLCRPLARYVVSRRYCPGREPERDDLEAICLGTLVLALRYWRPEQAAFTTYAIRAMWHACTKAQVQAALLGYRTSAQECPYQVVSLDYLIRGEDGEEDRLEERLASLSETEADAVRPFVQAEMRAWLERQLSDSPRLLKAVELRFGLDGRGARTLEDVGAALGCTKMGASSLVTRAIRRLRQSGYANVIWNGVDR